MGPRSSLVVDEPHDGVRGIWMSRPGVHNAIDRQLVQELLRAIGDPGARVIVIGSAARGSFCSGADLSVSDAERATVSAALYDVYGAILEAGCPVIAAVDGAAIGGGAQLAVACDLRVAGPSARFRFPGLGHGLAVGAWALPSLVGRGRAMDLCLTMREVSAADALDIGLVDRLSPDPAKDAVELAATLVELDGPAVARARDVVRVAAALPAALKLERDGNGNAWSGSTAGLRTTIGRGGEA